MTLQEVTTLPMTGDNTNLFLGLFNCQISPEDFLTRFEGAELTHSSLSVHPNTTDGWKLQFDQWLKDSILTV